MLKLRPNQVPFVEAIREATADHSYICAQAPTGYGKSFIIAFLTAQALGAGHTVHVHAHRSVILEQIADDFREFGIPFGEVHSGRPADPSQPVQLCTPFSMKGRLDWYKKPTFVLEDECHRVAAKTWSYVRDWYDTDKIYGVGLTATPARLDGKPLADRYDHLILGPTNRELIDDGTLVQPHVYAPPIEADWSQLKRGGYDYTTDSLEAVFNNKKITGQTVEHYQRIAPGTSAVVFCVSIKHAHEVAEGFEAAGIPAAAIDSKMSKYELKSIIKQFKDGHIKVLTSCDLITEGFNLPALETCIMLRRTKSLTLYLQAIGRVLRASAGKDRAIILDHVGNVYEHGMPDCEREWSLMGGCHGVADKRSMLKQCQACYLWHSSEAKECRCGHTFGGGAGGDRKERKWEYDAAGQLKLIEDEAPKINKALVQRAKLAGCKDYEDYVRVGKELGYRPGWARVQYNMRQNRGRFFAKKKRQANG